jgi:hypothetical protein
MTQPTPVQAQHLQSLLDAASLHVSAEQMPLIATALAISSTNLNWIEILGVSPQNHLRLSDGKLEFGATPDLWIEIPEPDIYWKELANYLEAQNVAPNNV